MFLSCQLTKRGCGNEGGLSQKATVLANGFTDSHKIEWKVGMHQSTGQRPEPERDR